MILLARADAVRVHPFLAIVMLFAAMPILGAQTGASPSTASQTQGGGPFSGSVASETVPGVLPLSLPTAIDRGPTQNLGALLSIDDIRSPRAPPSDPFSPPPPPA